MADDISVATPPAPTTSASPFTPMAEASALGTPPAVSEDGSAEGVAVNIPIKAQASADAGSGDDQTSSAPFTPPAVDESSSAPFTPPSAGVTTNDVADTTEASSDENANPIPMPPDLDASSETTTEATDPNHILNALTADSTTSSVAPSADQAIDATSSSVDGSAQVGKFESNDTIGDAVAKLNSAEVKVSTAEASGELSTNKPIANEALATDTTPKPVKPTDATKIITKSAPKVADDPRIKEHIVKVTAPVETMIANAQSMGNKELVGLLQKQKDELSQKAREDFAHNDKLKGERLSRAAQTIAIILQTRSAGQRVGEQVLYEYDPEASAQAGVTEFANSELALEAARAVYQLVGAKEPNDLAESEADENGNKVATATRDTDIGVQLKEWVNLDANGSILQMRISTAEI